jgi:hypothetical protein
MLTVPERTTGRLYSTPVDVITVARDADVSDPVGVPVASDQPALTAEATLSRGRHSQRFKVEETAAAEAVPVLRRYIAEIRVARPYFDARPESPDGDAPASRPPASKSTVAR